MTAVQVNSSRLRSVAAGDVGVEEFWQATTTTGTPLVEPDPHDPGQALVTFLWRGDHDRVVVLGGVGDWQNFSRTDMTRLPGTDLWYLTRSLPRDTRTVYWYVTDPPIDGAFADKDLACLAPASHPDPHNPRTWGSPAKSVLELPDAPPQPWIVSRDGIPAGRLEQHDSTDRTLPDGKRRIWSYTPTGHTSTGDRYPLLIIFDGDVYIDPAYVPGTTILDNLIAEGLIPPVVAVFIDSLDNDDRNRDLSCDPTFTRYVIDTVIPWAQDQLHATTDPAHTIAAGSSLGGLTAAYAAFTAPEAIGAVLSQSGAFWWHPDQEPVDSMWLVNQYATAPRRPLRFWLEVGLFETTRGRAGELDLLESNRALVTVLRDKGYPVTYHEFSGGHDYPCWRGSFADGLIPLLGG